MRAEATAGLQKLHALDVFGGEGNLSCSLIDAGYRSEKYEVEDDPTGKDILKLLVLCWLGSD